MMSSETVQILTSIGLCALVVGLIYIISADVNRSINKAIVENYGLTFDQWCVKVYHVKDGQYTRRNSPNILENKRQVKRQYKKYVERLVENCNYLMEDVK